MADGTRSQISLQDIARRLDGMQEDLQSTQAKHDRDLLELKDMIWALTHLVRPPRGSKPPGFHGSGHLVSPPSGSRTNPTQEMEDGRANGLCIQNPSDRFHPSRCLTMAPFSTTFPQYVRLLQNSLDGSNSDTVFGELCDALEIIDADIAQQLALRRKQTRQASPSTNALLTGPSLASVSLPLPFSSSSGQFNRGGFSSALGLGPIAQPLSIASDKTDTPLPQIFSGAPSNQGRIADIVEPVQQRADLDATIMAPSSISAIQELLPAEPSVSVKDHGTPSHPLPLPSSERIGTSVSKSLLSTVDALDKYHMVASKPKLEALLANGRESDMQSVISEVPQIILRCVARDEAATVVAHEVISSDDKRRFNRDITVGLIRRELLNLFEWRSCLFRERIKLHLNLPALLLLHS